MLRIKLRYDDVDAMVQKFAPNVGKNGLFLPTKTLQTVGTEIKFELRLSNDQPVLVGLGRVKAAKAPDPANPRAAFGLAIELMRVTREGREVIIRMIERRRQLGLPDVAIPMPEDVEASKRADVETQPRAELAAIVKEAAPAADSAPILETPPPKVLPVPRVTPSGSFTAPRAPVTKETVRPTAPSLAPEPLRAKRPKMAELIAQASGPVVVATDVPELDEHVDVERAMARARALAGGDVDAELEALRETSAAPLVEISIEAASAELARQLGGAAISRRTRLPVPAIGTSEMPAAAPPALPSEDQPAVAGEAPPVESSVAAAAELAPPEAIASEVDPPAGELPPAAEAPAEPAPIPTEAPVEAVAGRELFATRGSAIEIARESTVIGQVPLVRSEDAPPVAPVADVPVATEVVAALEARPTAEIVDVDPELDAFDKALDAARIHTGVAIDAAPDDDEDIAELDPDDIEELPGESTQIGAVASAIDPRVGVAEPMHLEQSLDRQLDEAEGENDIARSIAAAAQVYEAELGQTPTGDEEIDDLDVLAEADVAPDPGADLLQQALGPYEDPNGAVGYAETPMFSRGVDAEGNPIAVDATGRPILDDNGDIIYIDDNGYSIYGQTPAAAYFAPQPETAYQPALAPEHLDPNEFPETVAPNPDDPFANAYTEAPQYADPNTYADPSAYGSDSNAFQPAPDPSGFTYTPDPDEPARPQPAPKPYARDLDIATRPGEVALPAAAYPERPSSEFDFAANLDLDDDSLPPGPPMPYPAGYEQPSEYTFAEKLPVRAPSFAEVPHTPGLDEALEFDEPHQFQSHTPAQPEPRRRSSRYPTPNPESIDFDEPHAFARQDENDDLESALSTLDVDLDHLEIPPEKRRRATRERESRPLPGMPPARAQIDPPTVRPTGEDLQRIARKPAVKDDDDDGVLIDFDDD